MKLWLIKAIHGESRKPGSTIHFLDHHSSWALSGESEARHKTFVPQSCADCCPSNTITLGTSQMISKHSPLPQFLDEEVALIVNDDSSPRADTKRVAHSVSVILLKDGLGLPKGSSRLRGLFQASRWGSSGSCWKEKNGRVAGRAQSRRPLKWQHGALRATSRNLEKTGPGNAGSKKAGVRCLKASGPAATPRPLPPTPAHL